MTDSAKLTENPWCIGVRCQLEKLPWAAYPGDNREWHKAGGWLLPLDSLTLSLLKTTWASMALLKWEFFFLRINLSSTSWITKHTFACAQAWNIIHFLCCCPEMPFKALWTQLSNKHNLLHVMFFLKSWNFLCVFLKKGRLHFFTPLLQP